MTGQVRAVTFHAHFPKVINAVAANKRHKHCQEQASGSREGQRKMPRKAVGQQTGGAALMSASVSCVCVCAMLGVDMAAT